MNLVEKIHASPYRIVLAIAGAGQGFLSDLLGVPGASHTLLEATVPYCQRAFDDFLGKVPKQYVSEKSARLLAGRAYTRARQLRNSSDVEVIGLSCTASLVTNRTKRGEHRGYVAAWTRERVTVCGTTLTKDRRTRGEEEAVYSRLLLQTLAQACQLAERVELGLNDAETLQSTAFDFSEVAHGLHAGKLPFFAVHDHGRIRTQDVHPQTLLSGSFNPLHSGHLRMAEAATEILGRPVAFELSAFNVDKPPISPETVLERMSQFAGRYPIYISNAPTYVEKARLYPGATFVIGYDTAVRLFDTKYYGDCQQNLAAALDEIVEKGCTFLVAGRKINGHFRTLADINIPNRYASLFRAIPEGQFRLDLSSSQLRASGLKGSR